LAFFLSSDKNIGFHICIKVFLWIYYKEEENIGKHCQEKSSGKCLFLLLSKENLEQQTIGKIKEEQKCR
jgi:hypothetical protein